MALATITSKGQVTIPQEVRKRLGLRAGDQLEFEVPPDGTLRVTPVSRKIDQVYGMLSARSRRRKPLSAKEIDDRLRKAFRNRAR